MLKRKSASLEISSSSSYRQPGDLEANSFKTLLKCLLAPTSSEAETDKEKGKTNKKRRSSRRTSSSCKNNELSSNDESDDCEILDQDYGNSENEKDENDLILSDDDDDDDLLDDGTNDSTTTFSPTRSTDPYVAHFGIDLSDSSQLLNSDLEFEKSPIESCRFLTPGWYFHSNFSRFLIDPAATTSFKLSNIVNTELYPDLSKMKVKATLCKQLFSSNARNIEKNASASTAKAYGLTPVQFELFCVLNSYTDLFCPKYNHESADEFRNVFCLHVLNHLLKSRKQIAMHNAAIKRIKNAKEKQKTNREFRDRGLTRPKILILVPFRESAYKIVKMMWSLLADSDRLVVSNRKRFVAEYTISTTESEDSSIKAKNFRATPLDFEQLFAGNVDDNFRLGLSISKRTVKIFTDFYNSDVIIASPLGLRSITPRSNGDGSKNQGNSSSTVSSNEEALFDFLSSIEILILDQADVCLMQNWEHVVGLMEHVNATPKQPHNVDFSRVRMWNLTDGIPARYRQTVVFSSIVLPELNAFFSKYSTNRNGRIVLTKVYEDGSVNNIRHQVPQLFHRIEPCNSLCAASDQRFTYFTAKILPNIIDSDIRQTLIYIPSYFDYVRLRNHCKREQMSCLWISEYTKDSQVSRVRSLFYHGKVVFLLYTERLHFFKRFRMRGVRNVVFYGLPSYPHFYSEIVNWLVDAAPGEAYQSVALYSRFDLFQLAGVVGSSVAVDMLSVTPSDNFRFDNFATKTKADNSNVSFSLPSKGLMLLRTALEYLKRSVEACRFGQVL